MSIATMNPSKVRLERLLDERATVTKLHEDLVSTVESREIGHREMSDVEHDQARGYRQRAVELDAEIETLHDALQRELTSLEASKAVRRTMAGSIDGVEMNASGEIAYRTFAQYARDQILAFPKGSVCEQIAKRAGGPEMIEAARERALRTPANTLSSDVGGLTPPQHLAQIFQVIDTSRPLVASAYRTTLERGQLTFPKVTQRPVVAVQSTEKTEAGNQTMLVGMETATASTYLGGGDLSWQAINWSTPDALELWFALAAADYALKTEQDAGEVIQTAAFLNDISTLFGATGSFAEFMTAVAAGIGAVYSNSGDLADTLYLAPDRAAYLLGLTSSTPAVFANGQLSFAAGSGSIAGLNVVISRGLDSGVIAVGVAKKLIVAETAGAPVELRVVEPAIGGVEVGIIGAFEAVVAEDEAFALLTAAS